MASECSNAVNSHDREISCDTTVGILIVSLVYLSHYQVHHEVNQFCSRHSLQEVYIDLFGEKAFVVVFIRLEVLEM